MLTKRIILLIFTIHTYIKSFYFYVKAYKMLYVELYLNKTKEKKTILHVIFRQRLIMKLLSAYARAKTCIFLKKRL